MRAADEMMPRLEAQESLLVFNRVGVATGSFKQERAVEIVKAWTTLAHPATAPAPRPPRTVESLRALGIKVHGVKAPSP